MSTIVKVDQEVELETVNESECPICKGPLDLRDEQTRQEGVCSGNCALIRDGAAIVSVDNGQTLGNGIIWDSVSPVLNVAVTVSFVSSATFSSTLFGKSVV